MKGTQEGLVFEKDGCTINCDIKIKTAKGLLFGVYLKRTTSEVSQAIVTSMNIKQAHERLGHHNEVTTRKIAKGLGWHITRGSMLPCQACAEAKAKQKNIPEKDDEQKKLAGILSLVDKKISSTEKELTQLKKLKKGLMQDLLTGKVRVEV